MKTESGIWVAWADMHFPHIHQPTFNAMLDFIKRNRRKIVGAIDLGDSFDNASISPHNRTKPLFQIEGSFAKETKDYERKILTPLEAVLPARAKKVMITGNHTRWEQDYVELHPELAGVIDRFKSLDLKGRGWKIIPLGLAYHIGKLALIHGDQLGGPYGGGVMPSRKAAEVYGNVLMGHTHSPQSFTRVSPVDVQDKRMAYVAPTMGTTNAHSCGISRIAGRMV